MVHLGLCVVGVGSEGFPSFLTDPGSSPDRMCEGREETKQTPAEAMWHPGQTKALEETPTSL